VSLTVWMSAADPCVALSGYVFGISEPESMANIAGEPIHGYYYGHGSVLGPTPGSYRLTLNVC